MSTLTTEFIADRLKEIVGPDRVSTNYIDREAYMHTFAYTAWPHRPDVIIKPESDPTGNNPIPRVVSFANRCKIPIVAKGGIGVGGSTCREGGILIDMSDMNKILAVNPELQYVVVEAGASIYNIHRQLRNYDMVLPNFGTYESGTLVASAFVRGGIGYGATRYGFFNDLVMGVEVVFPDGEVVKFGALSNEDTPFGPFQKNVNLPDFVGVFANSVGNFGILTRLALKTIEGKREWFHHYCYSFKRDQIDNLQETMIKLVKREIYDIHLTDRWSFHWPMVEGFIDESRLPKDAWFFMLPTIFARTENELKAKEEQLREICEGLGGLKNQEICDKYYGTKDRWQAYHITGPNGVLSIMARHCGTFAVTENSVPLNGFKDAYEFCEEKSKEYGLWIPERSPSIDAFVTKYSGIKIEQGMWYNPYDIESFVNVFKWLNTCYKWTTEKGPCYLAPSIPAHKRHVFEKYGNTYSWFKRFKQMVDPNNIMNPGSLT